MINPEFISPFRANRTLWSPNEGSRGDSDISLIILHATADGGNERGAEKWMIDPKSQASAHLHIRRDGTITRHVSDEQRAWHAGKSSWEGIKDVNSESLGWEIANRNDGKEPYTAEQYRTVGRLLWHYLAQGISRANVLSHAQVAPDRKTDPLGWDWARMWKEVDALTVVPRVVIPRVAPTLNLAKIPIPTRAHVDEIVRVRRYGVEQVLAGLAVAEVLLRGVLAAKEGGGRAAVKEVADAVADYLKAPTAGGGLRP